ncbi:MAG: fluoride efflux transporter FluC [Microbacteriaceae bacterium]
MARESLKDALSGDQIRPHLLVFAGGALGTLLRALIGAFTENQLVALTVVNLLGSALLGFVHVYPVFESASRKLIWGVGFCGSFTTMSALSLLVIQQSGPSASWGWFIPISAALGIASYALGRWLAKWMQD